MYNELLRKSIKCHHIDKIMEAVDGGAGMSAICDNESDVCEVI
jgi:hypothetical protein